MPTNIEIMAESPELISELIPHLVNFLSEDNNESKVRLALFTIISTNKYDLAWKNISDRFLYLFNNKIHNIRPFNSENTIKRFINGAHESNNKNIGAYLTLFLINELGKGRKNKDFDSLVKNTYDIESIHRRVEKFIQTKNPVHLRDFSSQKSRDQITQTISEGLHDSIDSRKTHDFFFSHSGSWDDKGTLDVSYYVMYRFSTKRNDIVKTFIAIKPPTPLGSQCFSFTHVYPIDETNSKRITRGPILAYDQAFHFIGGSVTLRYSKTTNKVQGIKLIAIPLVHNNNFRLIAGVFLSHSLSWIPIIGRAALVHIGYKSELGSDINDRDASIKIIHSDSELYDDIKALNEKFTIVSQEKELQEVNEFILMSINNLPLVDRNLPSIESARRAIPAEDRREPLD